MPKIAIDIDDTLLHSWGDESVLNLYNKVFEKNLTYQDLLTHNFLGDESLREYFMHYHNETFDTLPLYPDAEDVIKSWKSQGYLVGTLTSRAEKYKDGTIVFLEKIFGKGFFDFYEFTADYSSDEKFRIANAISADIVIEDAPHHIEGYIANTDASIIVFHQPWNVDIVESDRVFCAKNWKEVGEIVAKIAE